MKNLKSTLEELAGSEEIEWIIPHPFLPPRYKKVCENRNMLLLMDRDLTVHIRWEGARRGEWSSPSPGEVRRLIREVKANMKKYRQELDVFSKFVTEWAETPFGNPIGDDPSSRREPRKAEPKEEEVVADLGPPIKTVPMSYMGGESPMGLDALEELFGK